MNAVETLGKRLCRLREARNLSLKQLATQAGVSVSTYREWEYGRAIRGEPYLKLAQALGVSLNYLILGEAAASTRSWELVDSIEKNLRELKAHIVFLD